MRTLKTLLFFCITLFSLPAFAQFPLSDKAQISLLTCGPGDELYSVFGHTAIRVNDPTTGTDAVYNYGMFDFDTDNFYLKFVKGDLQYYVGVDSYRDFVYTYRYYNRDVYEQVLNLTYQQKQAIADALNASLQADKKFYTYKFIDRNCTTKVADIIKAHVPGGISFENSDKGKTNRRIIYEKLHNKFYESLGINLMFGYKTDVEQYKLFLPQQLLEGVSNTQTASGPLSQPVQTVFKAERGDKSSWWNNIYTFSVFMLAVLILSRKRQVAAVYLALTGMLGVIFCTVGLYSLHHEVRLNYNALLCNPLFLVLLYFMAKNNQKWINIFVYACLACIALYIVLMINKPHLIMMLPIIVTMVVVLWRQRDISKR
jgi:hypothetical protein